MARLIVDIAQLLVLLLFGHLVYGLTLGRSPLALSLVVIAIVFSMTCFAAIVAAFVRTREQAIPVGLSVVFVLAALGGLFWPLNDLPKWMQGAANGAVTTWSMFAIQDVILRDRGLAAVSSKLLILFAYGLGSFLIGLRLFRYGDGVGS
jgi:ABC-2 type transport system permease protein